jgi:biotin carboxyl carrier protein
MSARARAGTGDRIDDDGAQARVAAPLPGHDAVRVKLLPPAGGASDAGDPGPFVVEPGGGAELRHLDAERALLRTEGQAGAGQRVLLLPAAPGPWGGALRREIVVEGWRFEVEVESAARAELRERARRGREEAGQSGPTEVHAIIPGVIVAVAVAAGDRVMTGQQLLSVEAMKMQNELRAPRDGTIERVAVAPGRKVEVGDLLLVIT